MTKINQKIVPHLWYEKEAKEAADFYAYIFPDSKITNMTTFYDTPSGHLNLKLFEFWDKVYGQLVQGLILNLICCCLSP